MSDLNFNELMKPSGKSYWILDGRESSYNLRTVIQAWGGYWDKDLKKWTIDDIEENGVGYRAMEKRGLRLQCKQAQVKDD